MTGRVRVVVNPAAGKGRGAKALPEVRRAFAAVGVTDVRTTGARGEERALALVARERGRMLELAARLAVAPQLRQEVAAHAVEQVIGRERGVFANAIDDLEARGGPGRHRGGDRAVELDDG